MFSVQNKTNPEQGHNSFNCISFFLRVMWDNVLVIIQFQWYILMVFILGRGHKDPIWILTIIQWKPNQPHQNK